MTAPKSDDVYLKLILVKVLLSGPKNSREAVKHFGPAPGVTVTLSHMLGRRERCLRKLKEGERVVDSTSKKNLSSFVFLGLRIKVLVGNTGSTLPFALPNHNCNISSIISPKKRHLVLRHTRRLPLLLRLLQLHLSRWCGY